MEAMENKVVIVTGAGGAIGREIALLMAKSGASVVVNDLGCSPNGEGSSAAPADATVAMIRDAGGIAVASTDSVSDWKSACRIIDCALDNFGRIDSVVNNAGTVAFTLFHEIDPEDWVSMINTHLNGSFFVSRAAIPHFLKQKNGSFVHFTSSSGLFGRREQAHYSSAKLGITAMSRTIALETEHTPIRSNCIGPIAMSRMVGETTISEQAMQAISKMTPDKIAPMVVYLASDLASDVNAQVFYVRGDDLFFIQQCQPSPALVDESGWTVEKISSQAMPELRKYFEGMRGKDEAIIYNKALG